MIILRHTDAQWKDDLSDLPEVCRQESPPLDSPTAIVERIAEIPTRFKMTSECNRQLLITAAAKVVAQNKKEIEDFLAGRRRNPKFAEDVNFEDKPMEKVADFAKNSAAVVGSRR